MSIIYVIFNFFMGPIAAGIPDMLAICDRLAPSQSLPSISPYFWSQGKVTRRADEGSAIVIISCRPLCDSTNHSALPITKKSRLAYYLVHTIKSEKMFYTERQCTSKSIRIRASDIVFRIILALNDFYQINITWILFSKLLSMS